jgi:hypothetical protein
LSGEAVPSTVVAMESELEESGPEESRPEESRPGESRPGLLSVCRAGAVLRTRDRRAALIHHAEPAAGLIHGEVEMHGACVWRADGRYRDAAFGAPGPLDLMPPESMAPAATGQQRISIEEALAADHRPFCCD